MEAVGLIADAEGLRLKSYRCPAGVWTIGRGHTNGVRPGATCSVAEADAWFLEDISASAEAVKAACATKPDANELGAMTSLAFNVGDGAFAKSTVLRATNAGDRQAAARAFGLWNKATVDGKLTELPGLTARRSAESALYLKPEDGAPSHRMPQAVEPEETPSVGPIASSGTVTAGAGVLVALSEAQDKLGPVGAAVKAAKTFAIETLGLPAEWLLPALLIAAGAVVVYWRMKQRRGGWA